MSSPKISVIVPVYNTDKNDFRAAADCLLGQTFRDMEFVFVDDCGTSGAIDVVQELAQSDSRIRILKNEKNSGSGISRNRGIEAAQGEYLAFFDADDLCAPDFYEKLYAATNQGEYEIVKGGCKKRHEDGSVVVSDVNAMIRSRLDQGMPLYYAFNSQHWAAIYRRDFVKKHALAYGTSYSGQDTTFILKAAYFCKKFALADDAYYFYVVRNYSQTNNKKRIFYETRADSLNQKIDFLESVSCFGEDACRYLADKFHFETERIYEGSLLKCNHDRRLHVLYLSNLCKAMRRVRNRRLLKIFLSGELRRLLAAGPLGFLWHRRVKKLASRLKGMVCGR